ncbi:phytanoyl-CoA dioxygenase family protein [Paenibacillus lycopersici]|uniref:Phytanoyl-CoA dioxygenase family protein n=1 Tax=Paenibacillus lycopersici TaxID=2704462 RepID=A0A6C0FYS2_9BACL|nr:phytanoyl-CoA dioxygenase family protein [Paenibacillus lycopersici]QHT61232.1 phytanoyl-CoA dioxygenase family protein [Paenibacillus lycopersici]
MDEKEKYLFDLQGFIVIRDVLTTEQLAKLNKAIDEQAGIAPEERRSFMYWEEQAFRDLIDDPNTEPYLTEILGEEYRLDHEYSIIHQKGAPPLGLHGGGVPYDPGQYYTFQDGKMYSGLTVVSYALTDIGPDDGGFCCIPGSHKSNYRTPAEYKHYSEIGPVVHIPQKAGDVLIFSEALTHGTFAWQAAHERRSLLYKYSPAMISWAPFNRSQELLDMLTDRQKAIVQTPSSLGYRYFGKSRKK